MKYINIIFFLLFELNSFSYYQTDFKKNERNYIFSNNIILTYSKPSFFKDLSKAPEDWLCFINNSFKKENYLSLLGITASTLILIKYDRQIYEETQRFAKKLNISKEDKTKTFVKFNGVSIFRGPTDLGSAMYFLGDGWISIGLFASFKTYGIIKDDWRASSTANQLIEGLLITGFTTQFLKWSTGREMPKVAGENSTGRWHPYASDYISKRRRYDAFPSGHLATGMMTVTIIAENYPEKTYIKPLGYSLLALLSFQMINNGVHWISDYPLGLAIGYEIGKTISSKNLRKENKLANRNYFFIPYMANGGIGSSLIYRF